MSTNSVATKDQSAIKSKDAEAPYETSLRYKPLHSPHWKRWYWMELRTRDRLSSRVRWFFFLVYPAWVITHLDFYKPNEERVRNAFIGFELSSLQSPYAKMKALQEKVKQSDE